MPETSLLLIGTNHTYSSLTEREKILSSKYELDSRLFSEVMILSTCNREEIYVVTRDVEKGREALKKKFPVKNFYTYTNREGVFHLFRVAGGLDSMIPGEHEILGQVKKAYQTGISREKIGPILHRLCRQAIHAGKLVRAKTNIGRGSASLTHAAVVLAKQHVANFSTCQTLLIGAGEIARKLAKNLSKKTHITIANRTYKKAEKIANAYKVNVVPYDILEEVLATADFVISSAAISQPIVLYYPVKKIMEKRSHPLCFIDLGVPRNIQADVAKIENVFLYNLDDLQKLITENYKIRNDSILPAQEILQKEVDIFWKWYEKRTIPQIT